MCILLTDKGIVMIARRYTNIGVSSDVYCSSTFDYSFTVYMTDSGRRTKLDYSPTFGLTYFDRWGNPCSKVFPKYVINEIERLVYDAYLKNEITAYEFDREGQKRRKDYRYHDDELLAGEMKSLAPNGEA